MRYLQGWLCEHPGCGVRMLDQNDVHSCDTCYAEALCDEHYLEIPDGANCVKEICLKCAWHRLIARGGMDILQMAHSHVCAETERWDHPAFEIAGLVLHQAKGDVRRAA